MSKEAMQMALDALEYCDGYNGHIDVSEEIEALRAALSQPELEPVAYMITIEQQDGSKSTIPTIGRYKDILCTCDFGDPIPLYTAPPQRKPLSDKQIEDVFFGMEKFAKIDLKHFAHAIEVAHGIGEKS